MYVYVRAKGWREVKARWYKVEGGWERMRLDGRGKLKEPVFPPYPPRLTRSYTAAQPSGRNYVKLQRVTG